MKKEVTFLAAMVASGCFADIFGSGANQFSIDFVNIGNAGNAADSTGYGAVGYDYRIGKYEVTAAQWASVIAADSSVGNAGPYSGAKPTAGPSWYESAKFCNWLTSGSYEHGAYQFSDPNTLTGVDRAAAVSTYGTVYVLPTEDEWYKAAYFKSDGSGYTLYYTTGDSVPKAGAGGVNYNNAIRSVWNVGSGTSSSIENNGTFDMNGNVWEWNESAYDGTLDNMSEFRVLRGGAFDNNEVFLRSSVRLDRDPSIEFHVVGFRVAAIPEPSSIALFGLFSGGVLAIRRMFMM